MMDIAEKAFFFKSPTFMLQFFLPCLCVREGAQKLLRHKAWLKAHLFARVQLLAHLLGRCVETGLALCQCSFPGSGQPGWEGSGGAGSNVCSYLEMLQSSASICSTFCSTAHPRGGPLCLRVVAFNWATGDEISLLLVLWWKCFSSLTLSPVTSFGWSWKDWVSKPT